MTCARRVSGWVGRRSLVLRFALLSAVLVLLRLQEAAHATNAAYQTMVGAGDLYCLKKTFIPVGACAA